MTCIPLLFMRVLLMFYRSTMLIITHVYILFPPHRIVCGTNVHMKGNPCTACIHTEMCARSLALSFYSSIACIFHIRLILFFSCLSLPRILLACLSLSVIVVAP